MSNREIVVDRLGKRYSGDVIAVDNVSFKVDSGQVFGFLGPSGAGKSTTIKILTSLALPTTGSATVGGFDVVSRADEVRRIMGVALQDIGLDDLMTPIELLILQAQLFGTNGSEAGARAMELIELVGLTDAIDRRVGAYSGGMPRRLDLALALLLPLDLPDRQLCPPWAARWLAKDGRSGQSHNLCSGRDAGHPQCRLG